MEFGVLGPLQVLDDGHLIEVRAPKVRLLLAVLVLNANQPVSTDLLIESLWPVRPPASAGNTLQGYVSNLRRLLAGGEGAEIRTQANGYVLVVDPELIDARRFERLVLDARAALASSAVERAADTLKLALSLWRGPALVDFVYEPFATIEAARLEELRLTAVEEHTEAELARGRDAELVSQLQSLVDEHPLRERLWAQLMLALYRCGRQGEALRAFQIARRHLDEQLGIEPSAALRRLEEAVLLQKPELDWERPAPRVEEARLALPPLIAHMRDSPLVGRTGELERLKAEWEQAVAGDSRLVLLVGEPGVGKTRLAVEAALAAHDDGASVLYGRCDEDLAVPYQPFAEVVGSLVDTLGPDHVTHRVAGLAPYLGSLVPRAARAFAEAPSLDPETTQYRLFEAVTAFLEATAADRPLVVILDDLHWATRPTLLLLRHLVVHASSRPLLLLATYRDTEHPPQHQVNEVLGDMLRHQTVARVHLGGLDHAGVAEFLAGVAGRPLEPPEVRLAQTLHAQTGGNPFFLRELVRQLGDDGATFEFRTLSEALAEPLPEGVSRAVLKRLSRLSDAANDLLAVAAILGLEYELPVLLTSFGRPEGVALAAVDEALASGLVADIAGAAHRQRFAHELVRTTIQGQLSSARRAMLHRQVGSAMEEVFAARVCDLLPELAFHFLQAAYLSAADAARALAYTVQAAAQALAQVAYDEAVNYYEQALRLADGAMAVVDDVLRCDLLLWLGEAQRRAGDARHRETLLAAARLAQNLGDAERLASAALANSRGFWSATRTVDAERVATLEAALALAGDGDSSLRAQLLATLAAELVYAGEFEVNKCRSDEALAMARRVGDLPTLAKVLLTRYNVIRGDPGTLPERLANTEELMAVAERLPDPVLRGRATGWRAIAAMEAGDIHEAKPRFEARERLAIELRQPTMLWFSTYLAAGRHQLAGQFDEAEGLSNKALQIGIAAGQPDAHTIFFGQHIVLSFERGLLASLETTLASEGFLELAGRWLGGSWLALLYCELDRVDKAQEVLNPLSMNGFEDFPFDPLWLHAMTNFAMACAHVGDATASGALFAHLRPYADQIVTMSSIAYSGCVSHHLGLLAACCRFDEAEEYLSAAAAVHERIGAPGWLARTRLAQARQLCQNGLGGRRAEAMTLAEQAMVAARDLGMATVERRAVALVGSLTHT